MSAVTTHPPTVLLIGYGNPGRRDDGLGPAFAAALEQERLPGVTVDADYQLTVEDAAAATQHDVVLFVDADCVGPEPFSFQRLESGERLSFSSHSVSPGGVLALARELFGARTQAYVLGIRGYAFNEFGEGLTTRARANLDAALAFLKPVILRRTFSNAVVAPAGAPAPAAAVNEESSCKTEST